MPFATLGLSADLLRAVTAQGHTHPAAGNSGGLVAPRRPRGRPDRDRKDCRLHPSDVAPAEQVQWPTPIAPLPDADPNPGARGPGGRKRSHLSDHYLRNTAPFPRFG
jgi:hypothetical protein